MRRRRTTTSTTPSIYPAAPEIGFMQIAKKISAGAALFFLFRGIISLSDGEKSLTSNLVYTASSTLLMAGLNDLLEKGLVTYSKSVTAGEIIGRHVRVTESIRHINPETVKYNQLKIRQTLLVNAINLLSCLLMLSRYGNTWARLPKDVSTLSFSFPEALQENNAGPIMGLLHMPIIIPIFFTLSVIGVIYNAKELFLNLRSNTRRQGDAPLFGFINAMGQITLTASILSTMLPKTQAFTIQPGEDIQEQLQRIREAMSNPQEPPFFARTLTWFNSAAAYTGYISLMALGSNIYYSFVNKAQIQIEDPKPAQQSKMERKRGRRGAPPHHTADALPSAAAALSVPTEPAAATPLRRDEKRKTRGKATTIFAADSAAGSESVEDLPDITFKHTHLNRSEKLANIEIYRRYSQVRERDIQSLLTELRASLPGGNIENRGGSIHQLCWTYRGKTYRLQYESPHGRDSSRYQGFKLKKVLNVLETAYLWGWGRDNIEKHFEKTDSQRTLGKLADWLLRRPDFDEATAAGVSP